MVAETDLVIVVPGDDPVNTALVEFFEVPWDDPEASVQGFSPRGMDVDSNGVVWTVLSSGHFASFDRSQCEGPLNGPSATGRHCQEGWTLYPFPGPNYKGATDSGSAESAYYNFTDRFNLLGVGENVPLATGNLSEAAANLFAMLHALDQEIYTGIAVMPIPEIGLGIAINDRLHRAATSAKKM